MEATIRKEKRQSILNPNAQRKTSISTGDGDNPSLPSTSSTSPSKLDKRSVYASLGVGSVSSVPSRMHVGSRIDDSDVERAQRASMDLSRLEETAKDGGRWRSRSSAMAIGAYRGDDGLLSRAPLEEEEYDRRDFNNDTAGGYDVGRDDDSDDSLPPPVLESNFLGKKGETAVSTPSKQSVDLYGIPEEGHDFDPSGGEKGHSQSTRGGGKKPKTKRKKSTDPAGMIRSATENNELRGTGSLSEGFKDMNYGLRRSLDSFKVGAKFEVFRAKKKIGRALLG
ncbi:hypothetical protein BT69DRAFT_1319880 [Atractiella rhizophila]|nr:hypothetical protein BT69DRAFT_1319880 [Atractiella rhizophila]